MHFHYKCILKIKLYYGVIVFIPGKHKNWDVNRELQLDMIVPLVHCYMFIVNIIKHFIFNIKLLTFHFPEIMQHNSVFKSPKN